MTKSDQANRKKLKKENRLPFAYYRNYEVELFSFVSMAAVHYVLRDKKARGKTLVLLTFSYKGSRLRISTGLSTKITDWDFERQRFLECMENPSFRELNLFLDLLARQVVNRYNQWLVQRVKPDTDLFKRFIKDSLISRNEKSDSTFFWDLFDEFITEKRLEVKDVSDYDKALRKHLKAYETHSMQPLKLEDIQHRKSGFAKNFESYLSNFGKGNHDHKGLSLNTIGKQFKNLKVFLKWCFDNERYPPFSLSHLVTLSEPVQSIYLTSDELDRLEKLKLYGTHKTVRDLFLIGCETGLRYSDYSRLQRSWISHDNLYIVPKKSIQLRQNQGLIIPVSDRFNRILSHYPEELPVLNQNRLFQFNRILRNLGKEAGITELVHIYRIGNGLQVEEQVPKFSLMSSHTARRTFCTLKFLAGMPVESIMKFSGHTTERNFLKYLRLDNELNAAKFRRFF